MPEGHTIHRLARDHKRTLLGHHLGATSPQGRFAAGAARIDGRRLERIQPVGKHLFYGFDSGEWLHVHLGLYGSFVTAPLPSPEPRGALRLRLRTDAVYVDLRGPTACELLPPAGKKGIEARLGPDPLRVGADPTRTWDRLQRSRIPIGAALMDQSVLAGVGNVYRAELLFRHRVEPHRPSRELTEADWLAMWADLRTLMQAGVRAGRIVTTRAADRSRRSGPARRDDAYYVYRRTDLPCRICATPVRTEVMAGRNLYWCPVCQAR
ncbi:MAG: Fpg/Nei family DNA glycosylase [Actinomycetota bacterium]|nr:Fpg/Nei family DNA glycosylase [Actinomycetota bacterium]